MEAEERGYQSSRMDLNMGEAMDVTTDVGFLWLCIQNGCVYCCSFKYMTA